MMEQTAAADPTMLAKRSFMGPQRRVAKPCSNVRERIRLQEALAVGQQLQQTVSADQDVGEEVHTKANAD